MMNVLHTFTVALIVAAAIACAFPVAYAQSGSGIGKRSRMYNPAREITVKGRVQHVTHVQGQRASGGVHLTLSAESGTFEVILGPSWFLDQKNFKPVEGDELEVTGAKIKHQGQDAIIARRVGMDGRELTLRNPKGIPEWSGKGP